MKVIRVSRVISCWCKVVEFLCGKLRNSADEIFLPGIVKIAHSSSNSNVARGQVRCAGLSASTANHDLNSARAHHTGTTACMRNCKFLHEHTGARGSRPWEKWGTAGARGGDRGPPPRWRVGPRSGPLSSSGACAARSSDKSRRVSRLAPGCCCGGGFYRCWLVVGRAHGTAES